MHHAIALGLHTTALVLLKAAFSARGSRLMPDKVSYGLVSLATDQDGAERAIYRIGTVSISRLFGC